MGPGIAKMLGAMAEPPGQSDSWRERSFERRKPRFDCTCRIQANPISYNWIFGLGVNLRRDDGQSFLDSPILYGICRRGWLDWWSSTASWSYRWLLSDARSHLGCYFLNRIYRNSFDLRPSWLCMCDVPRYSLVSCGKTKHELVAGTNAKTHVGPFSFGLRYGDSG